MAEIGWLESYPAAVAAAREAQKLILLDLYKQPG